MHHLKYQNNHTDIVVVFTIILNVEEILIFRLKKVSGNEGLKHNNNFVYNDEYTKMKLFTYRVQKPELANKVIFNNLNLGGVHFTGSTNVFKNIWKTIGNNIE